MCCWQRARARGGWGNGNEGTSGLLQRSIQPLVELNEATAVPGGSVAFRVDVAGSLRLAGTNGLADRPGPRRG